MSYGEVSVSAINVSTVIDLGPDLVPVLFHTSLGSSRERLQIARLVKAGWAGLGCASIDGPLRFHSSSFLRHASSSSAVPLQLSTECWSVLSSCPPTLERLSQGPVRFQRPFHQPEQAAQPWWSLRQTRGTSDVCVDWKVTLESLGRATSERPRREPIRGKRALAAGSKVGRESSL